MPQIAQPRGPIDRRTRVVSLIAQLHLTGMHPDAQPDRGQRRPLQLQGSGHRVGRAGERRHEAVALALLDRAHTVVRGDDITDDVVESRDRARHHLGLGLPQPRRTLHVSQQQRHRAGRQKPAHAKIAPVHQRCVRTRIDVAHANHHAATMCGKTSAQTRRLQPIARVSTTPGPGYLRVVADGLAALASDSQLVRIRGGHHDRRRHRHQQPYRL